MSRLEAQEDDKLTQWWAEAKEELPPEDKKLVDGAFIATRRTTCIAVDVVRLFPQTMAVLYLADDSRFPGDRGLQGGAYLSGGNAGKALMHCQRLGTFGLGGRICNRTQVSTDATIIEIAAAESVCEAALGLVFLTA